MKDIFMGLDDAPDLLASIGGSMGDASVIFKGRNGITYNGRSVIQFLVEDAEAARRVLEEPGNAVKTVFR